MHQIRPWLLVGSLSETQDRPALDDAGVGAMLQLHRRVEQPGIASQYIPTQEGVVLPLHDLRQGIDFVLAQHEAGQRVLIACGAGVSRSVTFAVGTLAQAEGLSLVDAFGQIRKVHPRAMPDELHWKTLTQLFDEDIDFWQMWMEIEL